MGIQKSHLKALLFDLFQAQEAFLEVKMTF
jgi:hypothetical protein